MQLFNLHDSGGGSKGKVGFPHELNYLGNLIGGKSGDPYAPSLDKELYYSMGGYGGYGVGQKDLYGWLGQNAMPILQAAGLGGSMTRQLAADETNRGYGQSANLANRMSNTFNNPGWMDMTQYYAGGIGPAIQGTNFPGVGGSGGGGGGGGSWGPTGKSLQVADAALNAQANWQKDIYDRAIADARPAVAASYSARGLGSSGMAARGEQDAIQRITDDMTQRDVQNRINSLGVAASAAGNAGQEGVGWGNVGVGWGNVGLGRGNLAMEATRLPAQVQGQFIQNQLAAQQGQANPMALLGQGSQLFNMGLQMPMQSFQNIYNTSRAPLQLGVNLLGGTAGTFSDPILTKMGIPVRY